MKCGGSFSYPDNIIATSVTVPNKIPTENSFQNILNDASLEGNGNTIAKNNHTPLLYTYLYGTCIIYCALFIVSPQHAGI